jgi:signal transduction histidine kinase
MTIGTWTYERDLLSADCRGRPADSRETIRQLAHDLRQPIATIRALAYVTAAESQAPLLQRLRQISEEAAWISEIIDDLLGEPGSPLAPDWHRTEIHELLRDVVASQRLIYPGRIVLDQVNGKACYVPASPTRLRRALANLIANATRAAGPDGSVELTERTLDDVEVIDIADSGPGFGQVALVHGIGLRITQRVLAECEGHMSIERRSPGQTLVRLRLPILSETRGADSP